MKIVNNAAKPVTPAATEVAKGTTGKPGHAQGVQIDNSSSQVQISNTASTLLSGVKGSSAEFDAEKVARISKAIEDGTFKIDAAAIADKLIANAQEALGKIAPR